MASSFGIWDKIRKFLKSAHTWEGAQTITTTTSPQVTIGYDSTNKVTLAVSSSGDLTITASGGDVSFSDENILTTGTLGAKTITVTGAAGANGILYIADGDGATTPISIEAEATSAGVVDFIMYSYVGNVKTEILRYDASDDQWEPSKPFVFGPTDFGTNLGAVTMSEKTVTAASAAGTDESVSLLDVNGSSVSKIKIISNGDGTAETGHELVGGIWHTRTDAGAADYNPSILTSDYLITADNTAAARVIIISTEDVQSGSTSKPRFFTVVDEYGQAATNNLTVSLESGNISGAASYTIDAAYASVTFYVNGTNAFIV